MNVERSAENSKERILSAAEEVFAARGIDGARVDEIANQANINKRMIYHYFQSKEELYIAVLRANFEKVLAISSRPFNGTGNLKEQAATAISNYFYFLAQNPHFARLMAWEALQGGVHARKVLPAIWGEGLERLKAILEQGMSQGVFRPDLDLRQLLTSINALCSYYFINKDILSTLWDIDPVQPDMLEKRLKHILDLVFNYVTRP